MGIAYHARAAWACGRRSIQIGNIRSAWSGICPDCSTMKVVTLIIAWLAVHPDEPMAARNKHMACGGAVPTAVMRTADLRDSGIDRPRPAGYNCRILMRRQPETACHGGGVSDDKPLQDLKGSGN